MICFHCAYNFQKSWVQKPWLIYSCCPLWARYYLWISFYGQVVLATVVVPFTTVLLIENSFIFFVVLLPKNIQKKIEWKFLRIKRSWEISNVYSIEKNIYRKVLINIYIWFKNIELKLYHVSKCVDKQIFLNALQMVLLCINIFKCTS